METFELKENGRGAQVEQAVWAEISLRALTANLRRLQSALGDAGLLAVVKADGYGHGAVECARALAEAGVEWLGVTSAAEGVAVREALRGKAANILVMRGLLPGEIAAAMAAGLTPVVWTLEQVEALRAFAVKSGMAELAVHMEVDSGMSRQGVARAQLPGMLARFTGDSRLRLAGVMTHFASADEARSPQNAAQIASFAWALGQVRSAGLRPEWIHAGSTSTVDAGVSLPGMRELAADMGARLMCRTGLGLYGYALELSGADSRVRGELEPVLAWKTRVLSTLQVEAGARVGYNGSFVATGPMRLALLAVGYADGLRRELARGGEVLIAGRRARIVGRVSMDLTIVDVTGIAEAKAGDEAVILGAQGSERITAEDQARIAGTIAYEILCGISARVMRCHSAER